MSKQGLMYGIIGVIVGALLTGVVMANQNKQIAQSNTMMMEHNTQSSSGSIMSMQDMITGLQGKTGDDFDKTFISEMIMHHQGAIDMAKQAQTDAKHEEVKNLANDIISAQTKEINEMKQWQKNWGYIQ